MNFNSICSKRKARFLISDFQGPHLLVACACVSGIDAVSVQWHNPLQKCSKKSSSLSNTDETAGSELASLLAVAYKRYSRDTNFVSPLHRAIK